MAECGQMVSGGVTSFPCTVQVPNEGGPHPGPHAAVEVPRSTRARETWEKQQQEGARARAVLAESQGAPQSFHEMRGDVTSATPVPGSDLQPREYREAHQPRVGEFGERGSDEPQPIEGSHAEQVAPTWNGETDGAPYACPLCNSVGTGLGMKAHLDEEHREKSLIGVSVDTATPSPSPFSEPTKQREGDQSLPRVNEGKFIQDLVIEDINDRVAVGIKRYGTPLQALNGRDAFLDAYEEALDLATYLRQVREERREMLGHANFVYGFLTAVLTKEQIVSGLEEAQHRAEKLMNWLGT